MFDIVVTVLLVHNNNDTTMYFHNCKLVNVELQHRLNQGEKLVTHNIITEKHMRESQVLFIQNKREREKKILTIKKSY